MEWATLRQVPRMNRSIRSGSTTRPSPEGFENVPHDFLCQIFGSRYIETQMAQPVEPRPVQEAATELGLLRRGLFPAFGDSAGELGIGLLVRDGHLVDPIKRPVTARSFPARLDGGQRP